MVKFSLTWEAHSQNISRGLASLQQNGEFVDMTLAADGHHVKVHQMVISLASPYLKEIITSLNNPHPVIFLTKVSYPILSAILEYIYTGEVVIEKNSINDLIEAAKELEIQGLNKLIFELASQELTAKAVDTACEPTCHSPREIQENSENEIQDYNNEETSVHYDGATMETGDDSHLNTAEEWKPENSSRSITNVKESNADKSMNVSNLHIQYTLSNMGNIQMIFNRCIYALRYSSVKNPQRKSLKNDGHRLWRCVDYFKKRCPAGVVTNDDVIVKRFAAHNHPFHDKKILKKVRDGAVFSELHNAEAKCKFKPPGKTSRDQI